MRLGNLAGVLVEVAVRTSAEITSGPCGIDCIVCHINTPKPANASTTGTQNRFIHIIIPSTIP